MVGDVAFVKSGVVHNETAFRTFIRSFCTFALKKASHFGQFPADASAPNGPPPHENSSSWRRNLRRERHHRPVSVFDLYWPELSPSVVNE